MSAPSATPLEPAAPRRLAADAAVTAARASVPPTGHPVYVPAVPHPVFGMLFAPPEERPVRSPLLVCGPFGWEDVTAHRPLRVWAQHLAERGHPTLRIDLPGTGDSAGNPEDNDLVTAWAAAIAAAAGWLAEAGETTTVTVLGVGLSGLLAVRAAVSAPAIGDLILWGVPTRGRAVVRQLQAFARMERESLPINTHEARLAAARAAGDPRLAPGGFLVSDETQAALRAIDLTTTALPRQAGRRALLLERDGLPVDGRLQAHLEACGVAVSVSPGQGFGQMTEHPQAATAPAATMETVDGWLDDLPSPPGTPTAGAARPPKAPELLAGNVRETPLPMPADGPDAFGILAEPVNGPRADTTVVFLNAGAMHHIGPNRMWTDASRRWAAAGIPCVRLDLGSLGDAPGPTISPISNQTLHHPGSVDQLIATLDLLQTQGLPDRFALVGLCAGSWLAFTAAGRDPRIRAAILFNPRALIWGPHISDDRDARVGKRIVRGSQWARVIRGEVDPARVLAILRAIVRYPAGILHRRRRRKRLATALQHLDTTGVNVTFAFTENEPLHAELAREGHLDQVTRSAHLRRVAILGRDHTMRPLDEQAQGHAVLDTELRRLAPPSRDGHG